MGTLPKAGSEVQHLPEHMSLQLGAVKATFRLSASFSGNGNLQQRKMRVASSDAATDARGTVVFFLLMTISNAQDNRALTE